MFYRKSLQEKGEIRNANSSKELLLYEIKKIPSEDQFLAGDMHSTCPENHTMTDKPDVSKFQKYQELKVQTTLFVK